MISRLFSRDWSICAASRNYLLSQVRGLRRPALNTSQLPEGRRVGALAMKVGMLPIFDAWGVRHAATVLQLDHCKVIQPKEIETDGYTSLQLGIGEPKLKRVKITASGHFQKWKVDPSRKLMEFRVTPDALLPSGTVIHAQHFVAGQLVDVCGISKGKGFQGAMKRWNFKGGPASHGNSLSHRVLGSTGQCQDPGRVFKNKKMAGHMGVERVTVQNLRVLKIDPQRELLYVKGGIPGGRGTFVRIVDAVKGPFYPSPPPFPTYTGPVSQEEIFAPVAKEDPGKFKEPIDPF
mmetsp:Transcript_4087/g.4177  ORF Transcript_4087/g.4177 Transcript_4087/m.4177 type:complete len:291 (-) Transcript_4087:82-954(-)|eukprot:CAMPEP_0182429014 /NCGR_PEP_ID=MMETSP1167-20130531/25452_1 /TAXON_ID=2988 /ORGANISM="Mallomonas Sp, Strain CCMP3275" /LENGTH=290 /DNA_ID=CAMNT_0024612309 /DNA_START=115 /DNA_END=987 /DNA_ORIENTATION=-